MAVKHRLGYYLVRGFIVWVDDCDAHYLDEYQWSVTAKRRVVTFKDGRSFSLHQLIMGVKPPLEVDHRNRNSLDNRRSNLRVATRHQNNLNRKHSGRSGLKGVRKLKDSWQARITLHGKVNYLGTFPTPEQAARAYDKAARELHGEFAATNYPEGG